MYKKFAYHGQDREVFVLDQSAEDLKGIDLSHFTEAERKTAAEDLQRLFNKPKDCQSVSDQARLKELFQNFRHFKVSEITGSVQTTGNDFVYILYYSQVDPKTGEAVVVEEAWNDLDLAQQRKVNLEVVAKTKVQMSHAIRLFQQL